VKSSGQGGERESPKDRGHHLSIGEISTLKTAEGPECIRGEKAAEVFIATTKKEVLAGAKTKDKENHGGRRKGKKEGCARLLSHLASREEISRVSPGN